MSRTRSWAGQISTLPDVDRRILREVRRLTSYSEDVRAAGFRPSTLRVQRIRRRGGQAARVLRRTSVVEIRRLRGANQEPICYELTWIPSAIADRLPAGTLERSLYEGLAAIGELPARCRELLIARAPTKREQELLALRKRDVVIEIDRLSFNAAGRPVELTRNVLRADRYYFWLELDRVDRVTTPAKTR